MSSLFDIKTDENFEVQIDHRGDLASVDGREGFEQMLRNYVAANFQRLLSVDSDDNAEELARVYTQRVADQIDGVISVQAFDIERDPSNPETIEITIMYSNDAISEIGVTA